MKLFLLNILLAILWSAMMGRLSVLVLGMGFVLGYLVLLLARPAFGPSGYYAGLWRGLGFAAYYMWELLLSSLRVTIDVLSPRLDMRPAILAVPLDAETPAEITVFANLISLTPGTLTIDVSDDRQTLYVHAMYADDDADAVRRELKERLERKVLRLFRGRAED